eukprot:2525-Heterococcus_DN1.PRE.2
MQQYKCQQHEQLSMACSEQQSLAAIDSSCLCMHMSSNSHDSIVKQSTQSVRQQCMRSVPLHKFMYEEDLSAAMHAACICNAVCLAAVIMIAHATRSPLSAINVRACVHYVSANYLLPAVALTDAATDPTHLLSLICQCPS